MAGENDLRDMVRDLGFGSFAEVKRRMASSHVLLFLQNLGDGSDSEYSGKIFEYFGAKRPILALVSERAQIRRLFRETRCGWCLNARNSVEIETGIDTIYREFMNRHDIGFPGSDQTGMDAYSYVNIASDLSTLLREVSPGRAIKRKKMNPSQTG